jgi:hypothetical protein
MFISYNSPPCKNVIDNPGVYFDAKKAHPPAEDKQAMGVCWPIQHALNLHSPIEKIIIQ